MSRRADLGIHGSRRAGVRVSRDGLVVDPTEERLREEFKNTTALHLPMQSIVRIEEVAQRGPLAIRDAVSGEKIMPFPMPPSKMK